MTDTTPTTQPTDGDGATDRTSRDWRRLADEAGLDTSLFAVETDEPTAVCPYCGHPFRTAQLRALHLGQAHPTKLSDAELDAYEAARDQEDEELFIFHMKVVAAITLILFVFVYSYAFVW